MEIGYFRLIERTKFNPEGLLRASGLVEVVESGRVGRNDLLQKFYWKSGVVSNHMPLEGRPSELDGFFIAEEPKDVLSEDRRVISDESGVFALGERESAEM